PTGSRARSSTSAGASTRGRPRSIPRSVAIEHSRPGEHPCPQQAARGDRERGVNAPGSSPWPSWRSRPRPSWRGRSSRLSSAKARRLAVMSVGRYPEARPIVTTLERVPNTNYLRTFPPSRREESALKLADLLSRAIFFAVDDGDVRGAFELTRSLFNVGRSFG